MVQEMEEEIVKEIAKEIRWWCEVMWGVDVMWGNVQAYILGRSLECEEHKVVWGEKQKLWGGDCEVRGKYYPGGSNSVKKVLGVVRVMSGAWMDGWMDEQWMDNGWYHGLYTWLSMKMKIMNIFLLMIRFQNDI